jgi:hypothetical protein
MSQLDRNANHGEEVTRAPCGSREGSRGWP